MNDAARLVLENQLVTLSTLRVLFTGLADRGMLHDNALQLARIDSQIAKTTHALGADREPTHAERLTATMAAMGADAACPPRDQCRCEVEAEERGKRFAEQASRDEAARRGK